MTDRSLILPGWAVRAVLREVETPGSGKSQHRVRLRNLTRDRDGVRWHLGTQLHGVLFANDEDVRADALDWPQYLPFAVGDRIWVRETWARVPVSAARSWGGVPWRWNPDDDYEAAIFRASFDRSAPGTGWRSSATMPRWASRLTLIVTDVRVQRVQDISEEDARAEGYPLSWDEKPYDPPPPEVDSWQGYGRASMCLHWNRRHGPDAWARNDWVVASTFRPHARNIDMEADNG